MAIPLNVNIKRFLITAVAGITGLLIVLGVLLISGRLLQAIPLTGIGEYVVAAEKIEGTEFKMFPQIEMTKNLISTTNTSIELGHATIEGLMLKKNLNVSDVFDSYGVSNIDIVATSTIEITGKNLKLNVYDVKVKYPQFIDLQVQEKSSDMTERKLKQKVLGINIDNPLVANKLLTDENPQAVLKELDLTSVDLLLKDAELTTQYLSAKNILINPLGLRVKLENNLKD
ncbi:hypothetical protein [Pueribacillus sp. YX66]|uniref:hypothetical protein n=1 Tax=Pueribacillus sp. YX66 TaxID=3229242 RepID=UPI00358D0978